MTRIIQPLRTSGLEGDTPINLENMVDFYQQLTAETTPMRLEEVEPYPMLLILPTTLENSEKIKHIVQAEFGSLTEQLPFTNFSMVARYIYPVSESKPNSYLWLMLNSFLLGEMSEHAELIRLNDKSFLHPTAYGEITRVKLKIREELGIRPYKVSFRGQVETIKLHHVHAPDFTEISAQCSILTTHLKHDGSR